MHQSRLHNPKPNHRNQIIGISDDEDDDDEGRQELTTKDVIRICQEFERLCLKHGAFEGYID